MDLKISWEGLEEYFFSISGNGILDLTFFIILVLSFFYGKHLWVNLQFRRWRNAIPLSVGGWGTRGKSGTERLKAAVFNALGYSVISKTTGCEAMFIYTPACGDPKEMFLFRPYDKATIWEQSDLLKFSSKFGAEVFLWECMALTPSYVKVLQQDWMRDEMATITNTFPDHENLQGPAGYNIPEVMTEFISQKGHIITTEESMLPILTENARTKNVPIEGVGWLEAGLISEELIDRFPYEEHPFNIALVASMAQKLGFQTDHAIKEMSDRVVADLGVLKTYPTATISDRDLEFVMGMSANERFGCLGNWTRMEFDSESCYPENGVWISTVVNNRADRIARSEVFARILVHDIQADCHVLIGSNLAGLKSYIDKERELYKSKLFGKFKLKKADDLLLILKDQAKLFRVSINKTQLLKKLSFFLEEEVLLSLKAIPQVDDWFTYLKKESEQNEFLDEDCLQWAEFFCLEYTEFTTLKLNLKKEKDKEIPFQNLIEWNDQVFDSKICIIHDTMASGDQIIKTITATMPPGFRNRIMGMQNIKGTGLDFVYKWQAWELIHQWGKDLIDKDSSKAQNALEQLTSFQEFGILDQEYLTIIIEKARHLPNAQSESFQAMLNRLEVRHKNLQDEISQDDDSDNLKGDSFVKRLVSLFEPLLDSGDAVKRRKGADQIYNDLTNERISMDEASVELRKLTKRQKGGWLTNKL